jgi:hypothetical protein
LDLFRNGAVGFINWLDSLRYFTVRAAENFSFHHAIFSVLVEASDVTEELLNALLSFRTLELRDHHDCTGIKFIAAFVSFGDAAPAKATLILKLIGVDLGHTI